ncbi:MULTISPECIES: hypothetical protein [Lactococcus]|uniref:hypothetical protein n=1 Tax=Lactococcus TaxID=1357 RepID=UPI0020421E92|nr:MULTISPECIES: hypothetical protein [Lactococcus]
MSYILVIVMLTALIAAIVYFIKRKRKAGLVALGVAAVSFIIIGISPSPSETESAKESEPNTEQTGAEQAKKDEEARAKQEAEQKAKEEAEAKAATEEKARAEEEEKLNSFHQGSEWLRVYHALVSKGYTVEASFTDDEAGRFKAKINGNPIDIVKDLDPTNQEDRLSVDAFVVDSITLDGNVAKVIVN